MIGNVRFSSGQMQKYFRLRNEVIHPTEQLKERFVMSALISKDSGKWNVEFSSSRSVLSYVMLMSQLQA